MPLHALKFSHRLALLDGNHDGRLCSYGMDRVVVTGSSIDQPSTIRSMTRLDEERIAQLEEQYGVKLTRKARKEGAAADPQT